MLHEGRVGGDEDSSARRERLVERGREDDPRAQRDPGQEVSPAVQARPAHPVGIVHVEVHVGGQPQDLLEEPGRQVVAIHRVDAVAGEPDPAVPVGEAPDRVEGLVELAVLDHHLGRAAPRALQREGVVDGAMDLVIADHGIPLVHEGWNRDHVGRAGARGHQDPLGPEELGQQLLLQLSVEGRREVATGEGRLGAVAPVRFLGGVHQLRLELETQVGAAGKGRDVPAADAHPPPAELLALEVGEVVASLPSLIVGLEHGLVEGRDVHPTSQATGPAVAPEE